MSTIILGIESSCDDKSTIHNELFYIFVRKIKVTAYQNAEKDCTLGTRYRTGSIYRGYSFVEHTFCSAEVCCIRSQRTLPCNGY